MRGIALLAPALVVAVLFSIIPLIYLVRISLTEESTFFFTAKNTWDNYREVFDQYRPAIFETVYLAVLASAVDLVLGYPFAYILIRKVRYREFVRTMMTFPLFGPLYLAFGLFYVLLPNGPLGGIFTALGINVAKYLFSQTAVVFAMAVFTFPFMVMNIGAALSNVDPMLEEAARTLGARPWQTFHAHPLSVELERHCRRLPDVLWLESRRVRAAAAPGVAQRAVGDSAPDVLQRYWSSSTMGWPRRWASCSWSWRSPSPGCHFGFRAARSAPDRDGNVWSASLSQSAQTPARRSFNLRWLGTAVAHGYIWVWLVIFALPFLATLAYSLRTSTGGWSFSAYQYVFGSFKDNLLLSFETTVATIVINLVISIPAAYAIVRHPIPGKSFLLSTLNLSLYTPAVVMGVSLVIALAFLFRIPQTITGLIAAYVVGTFPLMLVPIIVALRDLPTRLRRGGADTRRHTNADVLARRVAAARARGSAPASC